MPVTIIGSQEGVSPEGASWVDAGRQKRVRIDKGEGEMKATKVVAEGLDHSHAAQLVVTNSGVLQFLDASGNVIKTFNGF